MQAADDVKLRDRLAPAFRRRAENFIQSHRISAVSAGLPPESAQLATGHADVGGIDVTVDVEIGEVPVPLFADVVRQMADGQKVVRVVKGDTVLKRQSLAGKNFLSNRLERCVFDLDFSAKHGRNHLNLNLLVPQSPRAGPAIAI